MLIESNEEKEGCLQNNGFQGQALLLPSPHHQPGYFGEGFESSDHLYLCSFIPLA
jgi:hypothetical protein